MDKTASYLARHGRHLEPLLLAKGSFFFPLQRTVLEDSSIDSARVIRLNSQTSSFRVKFS